jgi:hypothetical protein
MNCTPNGVSNGHRWTRIRGWPRSPASPKAPSPPTTRPSFDLRLAASGSNGLGTQGAAEHLAMPGGFGSACPPPPDRTLTVPHQHPRHRPQHPKMLPPNGIQIFSGAGRDQHRARPPRMPTHHRQHRQRGGGADLAEPDRHHHIGKPEVALGDLSGHIRRPRRRIRRRYTGRNSRTPSLSVRIEYDQPIRSAITVAGIRGYAANNSRIRGSASSVTGPGRSTLIIRRTIRGQRRLPWPIAKVLQEAGQFSPCCAVVSIQLPSRLAWFSTVVNRCHVRVN